MGALEDLTAAVEAQGKQLQQLTAEVIQLREKVQPSRQIYTLRTLSELPESPSLKSLYNRPELQPRGGIPDGYRGQVKCWYRETVEAWRRELSQGPAVEPAEPRLRVAR